MLKGKTAVVTGGSRGIGRAIALEFACQGANVAVIYAGNSSMADRTVEDICALGVLGKAFKCDVSDYSAVEETIKEISDAFGTVDILVNNAGITRDMICSRMTSSDFECVIDTNLTGAFNLIRHTYSGFVRARKGRIINITSVSGQMGNAGQANYAAAKAGLVGLTKSIAKELASRGVTCNAISPGFIETDMTGSLPSMIKENYIQNIPMKRGGLPEEVAQLASFLASDHAGYITGAVIPVDGGLSM